MCFESERNEKTGVSHLEMNPTKARRHEGTKARKHEGTTSRTSRSDGARKAEAEFGAGLAVGHIHVGAHGVA